jgi:hypothetical protein
MDSLVGIVFIIGSILLVIGSLMVIVEAFKLSFWWGLGVLFIPFVALIFVVLNWQAGRNGALVFILGALLSGVAFYGGADKALQLEQQLDKANVDMEKIPVNPKVVEMLEKRPGQVEVPNQAEAEALGIDTKKDIYDIEAERAEAPLVIPILEQAKQAKPPEQPAVPMTFQPVSRKRLKDYLGATVRVHTIDKGTHEGTLTEVDTKIESAFLLQQVDTGEVIYEYPFAKIEWLEVYAEAGKVPAPEEEVPVEEVITPRFLPEGQEPTEKTLPADAASKEDSTQPKAAPAAPTGEGTTDTIAPSPIQTQE